MATITKLLLVTMNKQCCFYLYGIQIIVLAMPIFTLDGSSFDMLSLNS